MKIQFRSRCTASRRLPRAARQVFWLILLLGAALFAGACDQMSCNDEPAGAKPQDTVRWAEKTRLAQFIPKTARTVMLSRDVASLTEALRFGTKRLPTPALAAATRTWSATTGIDLLDDEALKKIGVDLTQPASVFYDRGFWSVAAHVDNAETLQKALQKIQGAQNDRIEVREAEFGDMGLLELSMADAKIEAAQRVFVAYDDSTLLVAARVDDSALHSDASTLPEEWLPQSSRTRFVEDPAHRDLLREMTPIGEVVAVVRPAAWFSGQEKAQEQPDKPSHADVLRARLLDQIGPIGVTLTSVSLDKSAHVRVLTPGNLRAASMISSLGKADGEVPSVGGLIAPGVLGVARLSVSPKSLYELLSTALPADQRRDVSQFWDELDNELRINAQRDVLDNLRGHAVVVAYGLDRDALEASDAPWFLDVLKLQATREAVLLPIKERETLEQVLNALTTVSKGKLTRQMVGHTLQYAWMEDGQLTWAVILSDEHIIYIDSSVAFDHAVAYERGAGTVGEQVEKAGITRVFDTGDTAGFYLDTASLTNMLAEADEEYAVGWIAPFRSAIVTTREEGTMGVTDIELKMAAP